MKTRTVRRASFQTRAGAVGRPGRGRREAPPPLPSRRIPAPPPLVRREVKVGREGREGRGVEAVGRGDGEGNGSESRKGSDVKRKVSDERRTTGDEKRKTSDERRKTSDNKRKTSDGQRKTSDPSSEMKWSESVSGDTKRDAMHTFIRREIVYPHLLHYKQGSSRAHSPKLQPYYFYQVSPLQYH